MKSLIEIVKVLTRKKIAKIEVLDEQILKNKSTKFSQFYDAILTKKVETDRAAAQYLYNCSPDASKYRQIKSRFRKRLVNTLFFVDASAPASPEHDKAYFSCNKDWAVVQILLANEARVAATAIAKQILSSALKFHFSDYIVQCSRLLCEQAVLEGDEKEFEKHNAYIEKYIPIWKLEIKAQEIYARSTLEKTPAGIKIWCDQLLVLSEKHDLPAIVHYTNLAWIYYYETKLDYASMMEVCQTAQQFVNANSNFFGKKERTALHMKQMLGYLHLQDFKEGKNHAEKCRKTITEGSPNWLLFMEYYFLLCMHTNNTLHALAVFNPIVNSSVFKKLEYEEQEKWLIFEAYLNYTMESDNINTHFVTRQRRKAFKVSDFVNRPATYPKALAVLQMHRILLQILFLLQKRNYYGLIEKIDQMNNLSKQELKKNTNARMHIFIRLMRQLGKADFDVKKLKITEKMVKRLRETPFPYRGATADLEVLPYEELWQRVLKAIS